MFLVSVHDSAVRPGSLCVSRDVSDIVIFNALRNKFALREQGCF